VKFNEEFLLDSPGEATRVRVGEEVSKGEDEIGLLDDGLDGWERVRTD